LGYRSVAHSISKAGRANLREPGDELAFAQVEFGAGGGGTRSDGRPHRPQPGIRPHIEKQLQELLLKAMRRGGYGLFTLPATAPKRDGRSTVSRAEAGQSLTRYFEGKLSPGGVVTSPSKFFVIPSQTGSVTVNAMDDIPRPPTVRSTPRTAPASCVQSACLRAQPR